MDGHFRGYASVFGVPDLGRDVVERGAFAASLARRGPTGVRMLWQHDPAEPIGAWLALTEDAKGLRVEGKLNLSVQRAREVAALIADGALDGLSIGFRVVKALPERGGRRLVTLDLWEVSLVTFPLQPGARVLGHAGTGVRAIPRRTAGPTINPNRDLILRCRREVAASKEPSSNHRGFRRPPSRPAVAGTSG